MLILKYLQLLPMSSSNNLTNNVSQESCINLYYINSDIHTSIKINLIKVQHLWLGCDNIIIGELDLAVVCRG